MSRGRYSIKMLLATIIAGAIYSVIAEIFYQMAEDTVPACINTGLFYRIISGSWRYRIGNGKNDLQQVSRKY